MLSIIVPAYNEAKKLPETIKEVVDTLESRHLEYEVIIVDDGSKDDTLAKASSLAEQYPTVRVCGYKENRGKGYAIKHGFQFVQGDPVLFLDADLELPPSQIIRFLQYVSADSIDILIGSKSHPLSKVDATFSRRFLSKGYNLMVKLLFNLDITDVLVGLKLFRRRVLEQVLPKLSVHRYAFDVELLANAHRLGYSITEAPVELSYRFNSRIVIRGTWRIFLDTMKIFYRMKVLHSYDKR
jgi:glycosyltransferase involved in cell wall biosynthesis